MLFTIVAVWVSEDWQHYRSGARDCRMRAVDAVSSVVTYGAHDCTPKKASRKMVDVPLAPEVATKKGRVSARIISESPASGPTAGLQNLFPGPATLRVLLNGDTLLAETMGTPRQIVGLAEHAGQVIVVYRYEHEGALKTEVLGLDLSAALK